MIRQLEFRYIVIRDGADYSEVFPVSSGTPKLKMKDSSAIKTSLSGDFLIPSDDINWLTDEIRPQMIIDGTAYNLGVYLPATMRELETDTTRYLHVEAYDRCWRVRDNRSESRLHFNAGSNYIDVVIQLLTACGITLIAAIRSTATIAEDREDWDVGTSYLDIVNQLLSEINYNPLWFNQNGYAMLEPASIPTAANIEHTLDDTDIKSLLIPSISRETDIYSAPNVFICICSNPDKSDVMIARSENTNPQSPISTVRRKRPIVQVKKLNNIASQEELQAYADRIRNESMITSETIIVKTGLLPGIGVDDVTSIRYGDLFAVCLEREWSMDLKVGGQMTHTLEKVVVNIG